MSRHTWDYFECELCSRPALPDHFLCADHARTAQRHALQPGPKADGDAGGPRLKAPVGPPAGGPRLKAPVGPIARYLSAKKGERAPMNVCKCLYCDKLIARDRNGVWRHPGGAIYLRRCRACGYRSDDLRHANAQRCPQCGSPQWRDDHLATPDHDRRIDDVRP